MREFEALFFIRLFFKLLLAFTGVVILCLFALSVDDSVPFQSGEIIAEVPQLDMKAPFEAIPHTVFVREGQNVKAGDTLMILVNEQLQKDFKDAQVLHTSLLKSDSAISGLIRSAHEKMSNLKSEKLLNEKAFYSQKERIENELHSATQKVELNKDKLRSIAQEKLKIDSNLYKQNVLSKLDITNSYDNFSNYKSVLVESELGQRQILTKNTLLGNDFLKAQNAIDLKLIELRERVQELEKEKSASEKDLSSTTENFNFLKGQIRKQYVIAETDGEVQSLFNLKFAQNFVAKDQLLLSLVPRKDKYYAKVLIPQRDISYVKTGQEAHLKIDAFNFYDKGILKGEVAYIPERKPREDFFITIELAQDAPFKLKAGYSLKGEIIIERLKLYQFIAKKIFRKLEPQANETP